MPTPSPTAAPVASQEPTREPALVAAALPTEMPSNTGPANATYELLGAGCGVTGWGERDCLGLIRRRLGANVDLPKVRRVTHDIDHSKLSASIQAAMDKPRWRGVWYPSRRIEIAQRAYLLDSK